MVFLYSFFAVLCLGIAPFFGKSVINSVHPLAAFAIRTIIAAVLVLAWLLISQTHFELKNLPLTFWITVTIEAALAAVFADLAYFYALEKGTISQVALVVSCAPLITMMTGFVAFDEVISLKHIIGALLITGGLLIINLDY
jgi:bacterial/archaeal transporter family protein